jgi:hypothetical protein
MNMAILSWREPFSPATTDFGLAEVKRGGCGKTIRAIENIVAMWVG